MKYTVKMKNPKTGKVEAYTTEAETREALQPALDLFEKDAGYEILEVTDELKTFFYTFGTNPQFPYYRGWVEVRARDWKESHEKFRTRFPDVHEGVLNCAFYYSAEEFAKTDMASGRYPGESCHEIIE